MKKCCKICYYCLPITGMADGLCRRYPPVIDFTSDICSAVFPQIRNHFWCGEFKHKDKLIDLIVSHKPQAEVITPDFATSAKS